MNVLNVAQSVVIYTGMAAGLLVCTKVRSGHGDLVARLARCLCMCYLANVCDWYQHGRRLRLAFLFARRMLIQPLCWCRICTHAQCLVGHLAPQRPMYPSPYPARRASRMAA